MSEAMLEEIRDYNRILVRIKQIQDYLELTERSVFTSSQVAQIVKHIEDGSGWL
jgi:hypothetical protein